MKLNRSILIRLGLLGLFAALLPSCMGPAGRSQARQSARVETRTEHRMERRGW